MDTQDSFFPEITTLGDILQKEGYSQTLLIGSEATFGGRKLYFTDHGQYDIMDYDYAHDNGLIRKTIKSGGDMRMKNYSDLRKKDCWSYLNKIHHLILLC